MDRVHSLAIVHSEAFRARVVDHGKVLMAGLLGIDGAAAAIRARRSASGIRKRRHRGRPKAAART